MLYKLHGKMGWACAQFIDKIGVRYITLEDCAQTFKNINIYGVIRAAELSSITVEDVHERIRFHNKTTGQKIKLPKKE